MSKNECDHVWAYTGDVPHFDPGEKFTVPVTCVKCDAEGQEVYRISETNKTNR